MLLDARHLTRVAVGRVPFMFCPHPRPERCDTAGNWNVRPRWHSVPHRRCVLR